MLYRGCQYKKFTQRFVREDVVPQRSSAGHLNLERISGNDTLYCDGT